MAPSAALDGGPLQQLQQRPAAEHEALELLLELEKMRQDPAQGQFHKEHDLWKRITDVCEEGSERQKLPAKVATKIVQYCVEEERHEKEASGGEGEQKVQQLSRRRGRALQAALHFNASALQQVMGVCLAAVNKTTAGACSMHFLKAVLKLAIQSLGALPRYQYLGEQDMEGLAASFETVEGLRDLAKVSLPAGAVKLQELLTLVCLPSSSQSGCSPLGGKGQSMEEGSIGKKAVEFLVDLLPRVTDAAGKNESRWMQGGGGGSPAADASVVNALARVARARPVTANIIADRLVNCYKDCTRANVSLQHHHQRPNLLFLHTLRSTLSHMKLLPPEKPSSMPLSGLSNWYGQATAGGGSREAENGTAAQGNNHDKAESTSKEGGGDGADRRENGKRGTGAEKRENDTEKSGRDKDGNEKGDDNEDKVVVGEEEREEEEEEDEEEEEEEEEEGEEEEDEEGAQMAGKANAVSSSSQPEEDVAPWKESTTYPVVLGSSVHRQSTERFTTLRYTFKPASVDVNAQGTYDEQNNRTVTVTAKSNAPGGADNALVKFTGTAHPAADTECVVVFKGDHFRLERLSSQVGLHHEWEGHKAGRGKKKLSPAGAAGHKVTKSPKKRKTPGDASSSTPAKKAKAKAKANKPKSDSGRQPKKPLQTCPKCGKEWKRLSMHIKKCKQQAPSPS